MDGTRARLIEVVDALVGTATTDAELVSALDRLGEARRLVDAMGVELAGLVTDRSGPGDDSLARRLGARSPIDLIVQRAGVDGATASTWASLAQSIGERRSLLGEVLPSAHEPVAVAVREGSLSASSARDVVAAASACDLPLDERAGLESTLVEHAATLTPRALSRLCREVAAHFAPDDVALREAQLRARSGLHVSQRPDGMTRIVIDAHPEGAGYLLTALDARTAPKRVRFHDPDAVETDLRPLSARRFDALIDIARGSVAADHGTVAGTAVTMVVTVTLDTLMSGLGAAHVEGIDEPISAATARRLAAQAEIIPAVMGTRSEPLDLGKQFRLFTAAQRRAIALRDRGCVFENCDAPPGWCEIAHIVAWSLGGETDMANGAMMCSHHHRLFDQEGWQLEWRDGEPWLIPPAHVDATRTARRGGRRRAEAA